MTENEIPQEQGIDQQTQDRINIPALEAIQDGHVHVHVAEIDSAKVDHVQSPVRYRIPRAKHDRVHVKGDLDHLIPSHRKDHTRRRLLKTDPAQDQSPT